MTIELKTVSRRELNLTNPQSLDSIMSERGFERVYLPDHLPGLFTDRGSVISKHTQEELRARFTFGSLLEIDKVAVRLRGDLRRIHANLVQESPTQKLPLLLQARIQLHKLLGLRPISAQSLQSVTFSCTAPMPLAPETVETLGRRAKQLIGPEAICWLLFEPRWTVTEVSNALVNPIFANKDPVLVIQQGEDGPCYRAGGWDSDQEVFDSLLSKK